MSVRARAGETTEVPSEDVQLVRGPPDNLSVTGVSIAAPAEPEVEEGGTLDLDAEVETEGEGREPTVFWTSLDREVATEVEWSVNDSDIAASLGGGEFEVLATGETTVRAALADDPETSGGAVLIVETGPEILLRLEGDGQEAVVNTAVEVPPAVQVLDASERPLEGVEVLFEVTSDGGRVTGATARTDAEGAARPEQWVLGATAGPHTLEASVAEAPGLPPVVFEAVAVPGEPGSLELVAGDGQEARGGTEVEVAPAVRVLDEFGNPVPGASVTFVPDDFGGLNDDHRVLHAQPEVRTYRATGEMMEKYDVSDLTRVAGGGEYPTQDGFGWANGVALVLIAQERAESPVGASSGR